MPEAPTDDPRDVHDVVVVGGGIAGLSAALVLGRTRRRVLVLDTGEPAHAVSDGVHGFLSRDGTPPAELRATARAQLAPYDSVTVAEIAAVAAHRDPGGGFEVELADGSTVVSRRLLLAHGMRYDLPELPGLTESWGERVFHCPYCHGWEVRDTAVAVHASSERAAHQALLLTSLTDDVVVLGADTCEEAGRQTLQRAGVRLEPRELRRVSAGADQLVLELADGETLERQALFVQPALELPVGIGPALGAELTEGGTILTEPEGTTTVPGLYAAGDPAEFVQSVAVSAASGARAAYAINADLVAEDSAPS